MKKLWFLLIFLAGCAKEPELHLTAQLLVEGKSAYEITYGTSCKQTLPGEGKWATTLKVLPGDTLNLSVKTSKDPATLYMRVEVEEGLLFCRSLYIEPESTGVLNHVITP